MDTPRDPAILRRRKRRQAAAVAGAALVMVALSVAVSRLEPALPTAPSASLWFGTVKRGPMVRELRGAGTLVPEEIRWITATTGGRVERIVLRPGAAVEPDTVILELSNPDLVQNVRNAEVDWQTAVANLAHQRATTASARLAQQSALADSESSYNLALADLEMHRTLAERGLAAAFLVRTKQAAVDQASNRIELARKQLAAAVANEPLQLAAAQAAVAQRKADFDRLARQRDDLRVKATMHGLLQVVNVEVGQQVGSGANLARVSDPTRLKAEIRIAETQARDLAIGQKADVDTRNGHVPGVVSRIDPAAEGGTVGVDVTLSGPLPAGARPDLSVDGTVELERLDNVLFVEAPAFGQEHSTIALFKVSSDNTARRTPVKIGRRAVQFVEVVEGLVEGERVVLSDMSQYDAFDAVKLD